MKILIFSDSHGYCTPMLDVFKKQSGNFDHVIHLGDYTEDTKYINSVIVITPRLYVAGNNDSFSDFPLTRAVELFGVRIFMSHGHTFGVKSQSSALSLCAKKYNCSVALFGHTHIPSSFEENGVLLCNPGSIGISSSNTFTYGMLEIVENKVDFRIKVAK